MEGQELKNVSGMELVKTDEPRENLEKITVL